ncbi:hypothetical protein HZS_4637 [Henneguya salminicola]|nr:hypothetical protein HZS_4637 [Henneguya salminicola]
MKSYGRIHVNFIFTPLPILRNKQKVNKPIRKIELATAIKKQTPFWRACAIGHEEQNLKNGCIINTKFGAFHHSEIIGKEYGSKAIYDKTKT